jgi:hypothetical protein
MKELHFSKTYFKKEIFDDSKSGVRIVVREIPCIDIAEEEYSLRVSTRFEDEGTIHRDYAIEHHVDNPKHPFPHLQFKFHTESVGQFRIRIDVSDIEEYKQVILGFIYQIKNVLSEMEKYKKGITDEILVLELVNELKSNSEFLLKKINEGLLKYSAEFDKGVTREKVAGLNKHPLLPLFVGKENVEKIKSCMANK